MRFLFVNGRKNCAVTLHALKTCEVVLVLRKKHRLLGKNTKLPERRNGNVGHHVFCYRKFTALQKRYREVDKTAVEPAIYFVLTHRGEFTDIYV